MEKVEGSSGPHVFPDVGRDGPVDVADGVTVRTAMGLGDETYDRHGIRTYDSYGGAAIISAELAALLNPQRSAEDVPGQLQEWHDRQMAQY